MKKVKYLIIKFTWNAKLDLREREEIAKHSAFEQGAPAKG